MDEHSFQHYLLGLMAVANNIPAIPFFLGLCEELSPKEQHKLCIIATITSLITMITAMITGMSILGFFDISIYAFRIAGGLLLLNTGLNMMNSSQQVVVQEGGKYSFSKMISLAVIPISIPLTTGAGTMSTVILFTQQIHHSDTLMIKLISAILCMTLIIYLSFRYSPQLIKILGHTGMDVLAKIFGLITLALGIQFMITGIQGAFPKLM
ncbi:MAG: MarC family protein [Syntrophobacteraceae bacterium]